MSVHKSATAARRITERGCCLLFLPPYSPDFAPIEQVFSKLKTVVRHRGTGSRTALEDAIAAQLL